MPTKIPNNDQRLDILSQPKNHLPSLQCSKFISDMSVKLWNTKNLTKPISISHDKHHEFVQGIDWSPLIQNLIASISWDQKMYVWMVNEQQPFIA